MTEWLSQAIDGSAALFGTEPLFARGFVAVLLVSLISGIVSSLVVGNRMSFFSDAMAHCALGGVGLGVLIAMLTSSGPIDDQLDWFVPLVMVGFGIIVGVSIAFVREKTALSSDTVIGVFFSGALGLSVLIFTLLSRLRSRYFDLEIFLFGSPMFVTESELIYLAILLILTLVVLLMRYNAIVMTSFNPSLARSRRIPVRLYNYLFVALLALIVNLSIRAVGMLLINALLIVPAATAANLSRNLRQMFWLTVVFSLTAGLLGYLLSFVIVIPVRGQDVPLQFGPGGLIVCLSVALFFLTMPLAGRVRAGQ